jgi:hypothetical protein
VFVRNHEMRAHPFRVRNRFFLILFFYGLNEAQNSSTG